MPAAGALCGGRPRETWRADGATPPNHASVPDARGKSSKCERARICMAPLRQSRISTRNRCSCRRPATSCCNGCHPRSAKAGPARRASETRRVTRTWNLYGLQRFLALLAAGQPIAIEVLFAPDGFMLSAPDPLWRDRESAQRRPGFEWLGSAQGARLAGALERDGLGVARLADDLPARRSRLRCAGRVGARGRTHACDLLSLRSPGASPLDTRRGSRFVSKRCSTRCGRRWRWSGCARTSGRRRWTCRRSWRVWTCPQVWRMRSGHCGRSSWTRRKPAWRPATPRSRLSWPGCSARPWNGQGRGTGRERSPQRIVCSWAW